MPKALTDEDKMPWGKYEGYLMEMIPASYFHWLWTNGKNKEVCCPVHLYIKNSMSALKSEYPDGIWE